MVFQIITGCKTIKMDSPPQFVRANEPLKPKSLARMSFFHSIYFQANFQRTCSHTFPAALKSKCIYQWSNLSGLKDSEIFLTHFSLNTENPKRRKCWRNDGNHHPCLFLLSARIQRYPAAHVRQAGKMRKFNTHTSKIFPRNLIKLKFLRFLFQILRDKPSNVS